MLDRLILLMLLCIWLIIFLMFVVVCLIVLVICLLEGIRKFCFCNKFWVVRELVLVGKKGNFRRLLDNFVFSFFVFWVGLEGVILKKIFYFIICWLLFIFEKLVFRVGLNRLKWDCCVFCVCRICGVSECLKW